MILKISKKMVFNKLIIKLFKLFLRGKVLRYSLMSNLIQQGCKPIKIQPVLMLGLGRVFFGERVELGVSKSPCLYSGYGYIEARSSCAVIEIGNDVKINNDVKLIAMKGNISIGSNTLIGIGVEISTSDFHCIDPEKRLSGSKDYISASVSVGKNVFIGSGVKVLKGVTIGDNTVIAQGSIVTGDIPSNVVAAGIPAKVIKNI